MQKLLQAFKEIAEKLNTINITPVLFGSLGLAKLINRDLDSQDIDILIPEKYIKEDWQFFKDYIESLGYELINLSEHEFEKAGIKAAFADEEDLLPFADVDYRNLQISEGQTKYKELSLNDYLKVYSKSLKDSYRKNKNNNKDKEKINLLKYILSQ